MLRTVANVVVKDVDLSPALADLNTAVRTLSATMAPTALSRERRHVSSVTGSTLPRLIWPLPMPQSVSLDICLLCKFIERGLVLGFTAVFDVS